MFFYTAKFIFCTVADVIYIYIYIYIIICIKLDLLMRTFEALFIIPFVFFWIARKKTSVIYIYIYIVIIFHMHVISLSDVKLI